MFWGEYRLGRNLKFFAILTFLFSCFFSAHASSLKSQLTSIVENPALRGVKIGIDVQLLGTHKTLFLYHADEPLAPASNLKILTTSAALVRLGPNYRFVTRVLGGKIRNGILQSNLILRGGGDPTWNSHFFPSALVPLKRMAKQLRSQGIREVDGDLLVDDSLFSHQFTGIGWKYRYRWKSYAEEISALSLNNNRVQVTVLPESYGGAPTRVVLWPPCHCLHVLNHAWTSDYGTTLSINRHKIGNRLFVYGHIYRYSNGITFPFNVQDPPLFVGAVFKNVLRKYGIRIVGELKKLHLWKFKVKRG
jgi:D-alanyl-D-alanine carboxypeptidase/D-alanyl-D-alanine-endopeptidase (penicillin-binding protein 4)